MSLTDSHAAEKLLDTDQIRKSYRRLIRIAILMASLVALVYAPWCYFMGIAQWWHSLVFSAVVAALYPLARDRTPFPLFLACIFVFFTSVVSAA